MLLVRQLISLVGSSFRSYSLLHTSPVLLRTFAGITHDSEAQWEYIRKSLKQLEHEEKAEEVVIEDWELEAAEREEEMANEGEEELKQGKIGDVNKEGTVRWLKPSNIPLPGHVKEKIRKERKILRREERKKSAISLPDSFHFSQEFKSVLKRRLAAATKDRKNRFEMSPRQKRVSELISREVTEIVRTKLRSSDVKLSMVDITEVYVSRDLRSGIVYWNTSNDDEVYRNKVQKFLNGAGGFIRTSLAHSLPTHTTPKLKFVWDDRIEQSERLDRILKSWKESLDKETESEEREEEKA